MNIKVIKKSNIDDLQKANSFCSGRDSKMSLATAYKLGHTPIRSQLFDIEMYGIPQFVANQLVRSHIGLEKFMKSKRVDNGGLNFSLICDSICNGLAEADMAISRGEKNKAQELITWAINAIDNLPNKFDRLAPTDLLFQDINAEALIALAHKRLCTHASKETREIVEHIKALVEEQDPDLAQHMVKPCVACGLCRENKPCGFMATEVYAAERRFYKEMFKPKV